MQKLLRVEKKQHNVLTTVLWRITSEERNCIHGYSRFLCPKLSLTGYFEDIQNEFIFPLPLPPLQILPYEALYLSCV